MFFSLFFPYLCSGHSDGIHDCISSLLPTKNILLNCIFCLSPFISLILSHLPLQQFEQGGISFTIVMLCALIMIGGYSYLKDMATFYLALSVMILFFFLWLFSCCEKCVCIARHLIFVTPFLFISVFIILIYMEVKVSPEGLNIDDSLLIEEYCSNFTSTFSEEIEQCLQDVAVATSAYAQGYKLFLIYLMNVSVKLLLLTPGDHSSELI